MNPTMTVRFGSSWAKILSIMLLMFLPTLWGGCGTVLTRSVDLNEEFLRKEDREFPSGLSRTYSGTSLDLLIVTYAFRGEGPRFHGSPLFFWDLPLSLAADTVLLPLTAYEQIRYGNFGNDAPPLVLAARAGDESKVRDLLDQGTPVDVKTRSGLTALIVAAGWGRGPIVQALLNKGADANARTPKRWTALRAAADRDDTGIVQALLDKGADVNAEDFNGETALMWAVQLGHAGIVRALLDKGADVNAQPPKSFRGRTTLMMAVARFHHQTDIVQAFLEKGANVNAKDIDGKTALMIATEHEEMDLVEALLEKGANVNAKDQNGKTTLMIAVEHDKADLVQALLEKGANVNAKDIDGMTALGKATQQASMSPKTNVVDLLIRAGAKK